MYKKTINEKTPSKTWIHETSNGVLKGIEILEKELDDLNKQSAIEVKQLNKLQDVHYNTNMEIIQKENLLKKLKSISDDLLK
jgi:hypothetical protein